MTHLHCSEELGRVVTTGRRERARRPLSKGPNDLRALLRWLRAQRLTEGGEPDFVLQLPGRELRAIENLAHRIERIGRERAAREYWGRGTCIRGE